jgi:hypothetical protein
MTYGAAEFGFFSAAAAVVAVAVLIPTLQCVKMFFRW